MRMQKNTSITSSDGVRDRELLLVERCFAYLTRGEYIEGASENVKRSIRRNAKRSRVRNGEVFYAQREQVHTQSLKGSIYHLYFGLVYCEYGGKKAYSAQSLATGIKLSSRHFGIRKT